MKRLSIVFACFVAAISCDAEVYSDGPIEIDPSDGVQQESEECKLDGDSAADCIDNVTTDFVDCAPHVGQFVEGAPVHGQVKYADERPCTHYCSLNLKANSQVPVKYDKPFICCNCDEQAPDS